MRVSSPRSVEDLVECVRMYRALNDESFMPSSESMAIQSIKIKAKRGSFIRVALNDSDEICGWICCEAIQHPHIGFKVLQQTFFASRDVGFKAARAVKILHEAMLEEAIKCRFPMAVSTGSHMDPELTFAKLLEKYGWERRGYCAVKKTKWMPCEQPQSGPERGRHATLGSRPETGHPGSALPTPPRIKSLILAQP